MASKWERMFALQLRAADVPEPEREYRFHDTRRWRLDFAWPMYQVALECEGGTWSRGRHVRGMGFRNDCEKHNAAALLGWRVFRCTGDMIEDGTALELVEAALV